MVLFCGSTLNFESNSSQKDIEEESTTKATGLKKKRKSRENSNNHPNLKKDHSRIMLLD
jgi:hypothetical protein